MLLQGTQGQTSKQIGTPPSIGLGEYTELLITQLQARYYEATYRGYVFSASWPAAALAAPSATATGAFALFNPVSPTTYGGKNLVLLKIKVYLSTFSVGTTASAIGLVPIINQIPSSPGAGNTPVCSLIGSPNISVAAPYVSGTLIAANTKASRIVAGQYLDLAAGDVDDIPVDQVDGSIIIAPGSGITLAGIGGTPANVTIGASMEWMETTL